jgi:hypothetical protein
MADTSHDQVREVRLPVGIKSRQELDQAIEKLYGPNVSQVLERTQAKTLLHSDH